MQREKNHSKTHFVRYSIQKWWHDAIFGAYMVCWVCIVYTYIVHILSIFEKFPQRIIKYDLDRA